MNVNIRYDEGADAYTSNMLWDTLPVLGDGLGFELDWTLAGPSEAGNAMGLGATNAFATAVAICLFTNARAPNPDGGSDPQGWWGDLVSLDENDAPLGSLLWTLMRGPLNPTVVGQAILYAKQSLQTLITQGAVARIDVTATSEQVNGILYLVVSLYSQDGTRAYDQKFSVYWNQQTGT